MRKNLLSSLLLVTMMVFGASNAWGETFTASFRTNVWEAVYAYAWSGDGEDVVKFLGEWPGTQLTGTDGVYTVTIEAENAPEFIIFNNGGENQTNDLAFVNEMVVEGPWINPLPTEIVNAAFNPEADPLGWTQVVSGQYWAVSMQQIGVGKVHSEFATPTADETHLDSEFAAGFECRWATNFAAYTQQVKLPADYYVLSFDVENVNANTTAANYENRFFVKVGETTFMDGSTEWMQGNSAWTTHTIKFAVNEGDTTTISLGYGTASNNIGSANTPVLYVSHLVLSINEEALADAKVALQGVIDAAVALKTNERTAGLDDFNAAIEAAQQALEATDIEAVNAAIETLQAAMTTFENVNALFTAAAELQEVINAAEALKTDYRTAGLEDFNTAIAAAEEALEATAVETVEAAKTALTAAMAAFKKANYYIDFAAGEYYIIDAQSGLFMAAGHNWGTQGIVSEVGLDLILTPYEEPRSVTIDSRVINGGDSHFLGHNLFMDSSEWGWFLEYVGFGFYITDGTQYINIDQNDNLVLSDTPREWIIVSKQGLVDAMVEEATEENPVDATFLLQDPNFSRNDQRISAWTVSENCTNKNLSGGNDENRCAESWHSAFNIMQTVSNVPAGIYELTAQGFYRQDNEVEEDAPKFFANGVNGAVPVKTGEENGMSDASASFSAGLYTIDPIRFTVKEDGMMYVGIFTESTSQWVIWDNFRLTYFGAEPEEPIVDAISEVSVKAENKTIYNLKGQQVMNAQKGLYIINGKKVVK